MTGAKTGRVHARFHKQLKSMPTLINQSVLEHLRTNSLLCKGRSLGSSLAMLAAAYYARSYPGQCRYVGFGTNWAQVTTEGVFLLRCALVKAMLMTMR